MSNEDQVTVTQADRDAVARINKPFDAIVDAFFDVYGAVCQLEGDNPSDFTRAANIRFQEATTELRKALAQPASDREDGLRLVPVEATDEMLNAATRCTLDTVRYYAETQDAVLSHPGAYDVWTVMINAVPALAALTPSNRSDAVDGETALREALEALLVDAEDAIDGAWVGHPMRRSIATARAALSNTGTTNGGGK